MVYLYINVCHSEMLPTSSVFEPRFILVDSLLVIVLSLTGSDLINNMRLSFIYIIMVGGFTVIELQTFYSYILYMITF